VVLEPGLRATPPDGVKVTVLESDVEEPQGVKLKGTVYVIDDPAGRTTVSLMSPDPGEVKPVAPPVVVAV
jgi:hypothetical protein